MESGRIIMIMLAFCVLLVLFSVFEKPLKYAFKVLFNMTAGGCAISALNFIFAQTGIAVGINFVTLAFTGFLGVPGLAALYITKLVLLR